MTTDPPPDMKTVWQHQPTEAHAMDIETLRKKASGFQEIIRSRNIREYLISGLVIFTFGQHFFASTVPLLRLADVTMILATLFVCWQLHRRGSAQPCPPSATAGTYIRFHREQLLRQRAALRSVWLWAIGPFLPGMVITFIGRAQQGHAQRATAGIVVVALLCLIVWYVNHLAADGIDRQIVETDRALKDYE